MDRSIFHLLSVANTRKLIHNFFVLSICLCFLGLQSSSLQAQDVKSLETKKKKLYNDLESTKQLLEEIRSSKQTSVSELKVLQQQLKTREKIINTLKKQVNNVEENILDLGESIAQKEKDLFQEKEEYAKMVRHAYHNRSNQQFLVFLLSAETFNDAFRRMQYIRKYNSYRIEKVESIKQQQIELNEQQETLISQQSEKAILLQEESNAQETLIEEERVKTKLLNKLQSDEAKLAQEVERKQVAYNSLVGQIKSIIREKEKKEKALSPPVVAEAPPKPKTTTTVTKPKTTKSEPVPTKVPEAKELSSTFSKNKGKLPWPVKKGVITSRFGVQNHSDVAGIQIDNTGIDIATQKGSKAVVVFSGTVNTILFSPIFQSAIIVQHGDYYTVYGNIGEVEVEKGQKLKRGDSLGTIHTNNDGVTEVHFEVYKSDVNLNPTSWLVRK